MRDENEKMTAVKLGKLRFGRIGIRRGENRLEETRDDDGLLLSGINGYERKYFGKNADPASGGY